MIAWSSAFEIGIPVIDKQHQRIIEYINRVEQLKCESSNREQTSEILAMLVDYTLSHFEFEEALMEEAGYRELEEHQLTHRAFVQQLESLHARFKSGEPIASQLAHMLMHWLLEHIKEDDSSYAPIVKENILGKEPDYHLNWVQQMSQRIFRH
ncbi:bacteriohemerythrin [Teredinibacter turnerae]|uniref:bacteriohemerythrin n=1 Tax=Teredinibacter turnerae TaxID=2426 RepID=UPI00035C93FA|nr:bacteriohemerythrin [Teredinibacter turnerae]